MKSTAARCGRGLQVLVGLVFLGTTLGVLLTPKVSPNSYSHAAAALIAVAVFVLVALLMQWEDRLVTRFTWLKGHRWAFGIVLTTLLTAIAAVVARAVVYPATWDAGVIRKAASQTTPPLRIQQYFGLYPNNIPMLGLARAVRALGANAGLGYLESFLVFNCGCIFVILLASYAIGVVLRGQLTGVLATLGTFVLLGLNPWMSVGYTDMPTTALFVGGLALLLLASDTTRGRGIVLAVFGAISIGTSLVFKPMPAVALVAVVTVLLLESVRRRRPEWKRSGGALLAGLVLCGAAYLAAGATLRSAAQLDQKVIDRSTSASSLSYVAGGLLESKQNYGTSYGGYSGWLVQRMDNKSAGEQKQLSEQIIRQQLQRRGVAGTATYEWNKQLWTWGDATFWAYREGADSRAKAVHHDAVSKSVQQWNSLHGRWWHTHDTLLNGLWFGLLLTLGIGMLRVRYRPEMLFTALNCLGIALFILVFQGRSRYLIPFVPLVVVSALATAGGTLRPRLRGGLKGSVSRRGGL